MAWEKRQTTSLSESAQCGGRVFNYTQLDPDQCEFVAVASVDDLSSNQRLFFDIDDLPIVLFQIAGQLFAIGDVCSHDDGPLGEGEVDGLHVSCPRHGAQFDLRTGKALTLPAIVDIPAYPVRVHEGQIEIGIPIE